MKEIGKVLDATLTSQGLVITSKIYDKRIQRMIEGKCSICGKKEPMPFEILKGKKGCKHYQERMKELAKYCPTCGHKVKE